MSNYIIKTENLCKTGRISNIDLCVPEGAVYGFLGPNGAGKTTTLKLILGLIHPDSGSIYYDGILFTAKNRFTLLRETGSLIESPSYYGHLTGAENMEIVAKMKGLDASDVNDVLHEVRLYGQKDKKASRYSLGMKQRLGLAMALLGRPKLLILDEPTNGLDPAGIQEIRELIRSLPSAMNMTVIVSSHMLSEIEQMANVVGIINNGEMVYQGLLADLDPQGNQLENVFLELTCRSESL